MGEKQTIPSNRGSAFHKVKAARVHLAGERFGRLVAVQRHGPFWTWHCVCDCGKQVIVRGSALRNGNTKSCGCLNVDSLRSRFRKHGHSQGSLEYVSWLGMRARCRNPKNRSWKNYGGRGISVCSRWESFEAFLTDMGYAPSSKYTIERRNNELGYYPENCCWISKAEQGKNTRRVIRLSIDGVEKPLREWSHIFGLQEGTVYARYHLGIRDVEKLFAPTRRQRDSAI